MTDDHHQERLRLNPYSISCVSVWPAQAFRTAKVPVSTRYTLLERYTDGNVRWCAGGTCRTTLSDRLYTVEQFQARVVIIKSSSETQIHRLPRRMYNRPHK